MKALLMALIIIGKMMVDSATIMGDSGLKTPARQRQQG